MKPVNLKIGTDTFEGDDGKPETRDQYPWGLCITLNNDTLTRLGVESNALPGVGDMVAIIGIAKVRSISSHTDDENEQSNSVDLQITDLALAPPKRDEAKELKDAFYPAGGE
ncbi:TPA: capsid staple protein [Citrobacter farmeri]